MDKDVEEPLQFAFFQIQVLQDLMQRADHKAEIVLIANSILVTVLVALFPDMLDTFSRVNVLLKTIHLLSLVFYASTTVVSMYAAFQTVHPGTYESPASPQLVIAPLMYFREIIRTHKTQKEYAQALSDSTAQDRLNNAGSEIYDLSAILERKYNSLGQSINGLKASLVFWALFWALTTADNLFLAL